MRLGKLPAEGVTCEQCDAAGGVYRLDCQRCCARLVLSTRPSRSKASAMLAVIQRMPNAPGRKQVLDAVKTALAWGGK